jgi:hypothetical protein
MDWIKVLNKHILFDYTDLSDSEFRAWIKIMAVTAFMESMPTNEQLFPFVHHKTILSLQDKLKKRSIDLQDILKKVLRDAQEVVIKREAWKEKKKQQREDKKSVPVDNIGDIHPKRREEKRREEKNIKEIYKEKKVANAPVDFPSWIPKKTFDEYLKSRKKKLNPESYKRFFKKLKKICTESGATAEDILDQSIVNGWEGIFPLTTEVKNDGKRGNGGSGIREPKAYKKYEPEPEPKISEEERKRNLERVGGLIKQIGTNTTKV